MRVLVDDLRTVVASMREDYITVDTTEITVDDTTITVDGGAVPDYMAGHPREINARLLAKGKDRVKKHLRYPLVAVVLDTQEEVGKGLIHYKVNLAILTYTNRSYTAEERIENVFKPKLYPLYELFFKKLRQSGLYTWEGFQVMPEHIKVDRPYYGTEGKQGTEKNVFSDPVDAVEIIDLKISAYQVGRGSGCKP